MSDKKVTPVQWFEQQLDDLDIKVPFWVFNEAKEMESEKNQKFDEMLEMLEEVQRRVSIINSEPNGIVRETMINNLDLGIEQLIKEATEI